MTLSNLKSYKGILKVLLESLITLIFIASFTLIACGFDLKQANYTRMIACFAIVNYTRISFFTYASEKAMNSQDILILKSTIRKDKREIYNAKKNYEFNEAINKRNKIKKLEAYIVKLDNDNKNPNPKMRNWAFDYKNALIKNEPIEQFEKECSLNSIRHVKYEHIDPSKLFTYGENDKVVRSKYVHSKKTAFMNRAALSTITSTVLSIAIGFVSVDFSIKSAVMWFDLASYLIGMGSGICWGLSNGRASTQQEYSEVLNNIASLVRETKSSIMKDYVSTNPLDKEGDENDSL